MSCDKNTAARPGSPAAMSQRNRVLFAAKVTSQCPSGLIQAPAHLGFPEVGLPREDRGLVDRLRSPTIHAAS